MQLVNYVEFSRKKTRCDYSRLPFRWIDKNAMNGIETLDKIKEFNQDIPVVMLSSQDKIDVAISCMHHFDYVVKSETSFLRLQKITAYSILKKSKIKLVWPECNHLINIRNFKEYT
jgi:two-component SAPR family response regulator